MNVKQVLIFLVFFVLFLTPCLGQNLSGKVKGTVVDWQDARVPATILIFQNKRFQKTVMVNPEGEYDIELPVGSYTVKAQRFGFLQYRHKLLKVGQDEMRTLNIKLKLASVKIGKCPKGQLCL